MPDLMMSEIEELTEEEYSYFLAHGETEAKEKQKEEEYERFLKSHRMFDL